MLMATDKSNTAIKALHKPTTTRKVIVTITIINASNKTKTAELDR